MNSLYFGDQHGKSYYYNSIDLFIWDNSNFILGKLVENSFRINNDQTNAWLNQINELQQKLKKASAKGYIIFEYDIVRLGKRIDVILLIKHMVFSLEFKNGATLYKARDAEQAEDYALDIKNFHKESENLYVCPILIATEAPNKKNIINEYDDKQVFLQYANKNNFMSCIEDVYQKFGDDGNIDFEKWYNSQYCPTPTIIEAAVEAYINHTVSDIAHSEAGQFNVDKCQETVFKIINFAKENKKKCICFITGVPGAGKTLVGLDVASKTMIDKDRVVYLSGNGPLIKVIRRALTVNAISRNKDFSKEKKNKIETSVQSFIQDAYQFRKEAILNPYNAPDENVIIFDEAQRCWSKEKLSNWVKTKMNRQINMSEPQYFIDVMNRKEDWAVIICLVGLGQDIYDGEVGINEWFKSIINFYKDWHIFYSDKLFEQNEDVLVEKNRILCLENAHTESSLHLSTSIRSFRSELQSKFVDELLANNPFKAKKIYRDLVKKYPLYLTRDIKKAKEWVRSKVRGSQRCGVVASSSAQRLKPEGIFVPKEIDIVNWFLAPKEDLRSSNALEVVASEFKVQGLEIDYSLMCWDADLRRCNNNWDYYSFKGSRWNKRNKIDQKRYLLNSYRVLLTRARQGMVIFVPEGVDDYIDLTRKKEYYDSIYDYLHIECGISELK